MRRDQVLALLDARTAAEAVSEIDPSSEDGADALLFMLERRTSVRAACLALKALEGTESFIKAHALALRATEPTLRTWACRLGQLGSKDLERIVRTDPSLTVRLTALRSMPASDAVIRWAADDPHWRVRGELARAIDQGRLEGIVEGSSSEPASCLYEFCAGRERPSRTPPDAGWWDFDPAVVGAGARSARWSAEQAADLFVHPDARVRRVARRILIKRGTTEDIARVLALDPRVEHAFEQVGHLIERLDEDRKQGALKQVLARGTEEVILALLPFSGLLGEPWRVHPNPLFREAAMHARWALSALADGDAEVRCAGLRCMDLAELPTELHGTPKERQILVRRSPTLWQSGLQDDEPRVRAEALKVGIRVANTDPNAWLDDRSARVRAVAAAALGNTDIAAQDHSVRVWSAMAERFEQPAHELFGFERPARPARRKAASRIAAPDVDTGGWTPLGQTGLRVSRMGLSGHYGLARGAFEQSLSHGINLFFWEPSYEPQSEFFRDLSPSARETIVAVAGSFNASGRRVLSDLERALKRTQLGVIDVFVLFWVRSWGRLNDEVIEALEDAKRAGKIRVWGVSTHDRNLGCRIIERGYEPLFVRHNLAHRGAESSIFEATKAANAGLITFSNLLYGRILGGEDGPTPAECYAYSLSHAAVTATLSAPATEEQMKENLRALSLQLSSQRRATLESWGAACHAAETRFRRFIREV